MVMTYDEKIRKYEKEKEKTKAADKGTEIKKINGLAEEYCHAKLKPIFNKTNL